ncbi:MAG: MinD/ParA family protein [Candidatus Bathyarchaeota archaeon]|nr:MAG: MinD/ParA family protein [Candidatus Bathyarchaeota archaeon]
MGKIVAFHSYKGGTGKTLMSANLAMIFASRGRKVCLFDLDFRAPSLQTAFKNDGNEYWLNDYLNGVCDVKKVLVDLSQKDVRKGEFLIGLANPSTEAIREMMAKDRKWEMKALGRLLSLKDSLLNGMDFDYLIWDTGPGLHYSSINAIVSTDVALVVTTMDASDIEGTRRMTHELYDLFEKKTGILLNKVPVEIISSKTEKRKLRKHFETTHDLPILELVPCFCDILRASGTYIFTEENPEHPFTKIMDRIATKIERF